MASAFLVQVGPYGFGELRDRVSYTNRRWASRPKDKAHGDVQPGDHVVFYFTSHVEPAPSQVSEIYRVVDVTEDHETISLELAKRTARPLWRETVVDKVRRGELSRAFRRCGMPGFNICRIPAKDLDFLCGLAVDVSRGEPVRRASEP